MRARARAVGAVWLIGIAAAAAGCAGGSAQRDASPSGEAAVEPGVEVVLRRELVAQRQYVYYRLKPTGELLYTAGRRAMRNEDPERKPTWTGPIPASTRGELLSLARAARGQEGVPEVETAPTYRLTVREPGDLWPTERVSGPTPALEALYRALLDAQMRARPGVHEAEDRGA